MSIESFTAEHSPYKHGFVTEVETESIPKGLDEQTVERIWEKKGEPQFMLDFRMRAYQKWKESEEPHWGHFTYDPIDYQGMTYFSAPKNRPKLDSLEEVDPEVLNTFKRLGIPIEEQKRLSNVAVDMVFDSVSIGTTFKKKLDDAGVIFCSFNEAIHNHPELVKKYLASVVPVGDNYFATLNSAVFSDGSFVYVPKGVECPMEISTYFRINDKEAGQFERTLIIAEEGSSLSYLEGCTAPQYDSKQLHGAVVELVALDYAKIKYSTVQNWYSGDAKSGKGGIYNFVTKRGRCSGIHSKISWTQVEVGSAITWKYPSCILQGDYSTGEFYSVALTNGCMEADTGTKMIHLGKNTCSTIISKGISADHSHNTYRGQVLIHPKAKGARNYTQCDSMLVGNQCSANTFPEIQILNQSAQVEHEASTLKMDLEKLFYLQSRGIKLEDAINMVVNGFCKDVIKELPLEFSLEARELLALKLEGSVG
jgi:Fe-S cluster assembly protein SufB